MNRDIVLGGTVFSVPRLPLRVTREVYPICRKLAVGGLVERAIEGRGVLDATRDEMDDLIEIAFLSAKAADPTLTREAFEAMPVSPPELLDAYFQIRYQTGGWVPPELVAEANDAPGEDGGAASPPTSISTES